MGNKQNKNQTRQFTNSKIEESNLLNVKNQQAQKKVPATAKEGCFGSKTKNPKNTKIKSTKISNKSRSRKSSHVYDTRKSSIKVINEPNVAVDDQLFANHQSKVKLDIKINRFQPYQLLKDSDYFDSQQNDKQDLSKLKKVFQTNEIANYATPKQQKLLTVQIKTYLFDRNLTKITKSEV